MVQVGKIVQWLLVRYRLGIVLVALVLLVGLYYWMNLTPGIDDTEGATSVMGYITESPQVADRVHQSTDGCHVAHIAMVCAGYNASRHVVSAIKSLLFYRSVLLHVHFIVDPPAKKILGTLFRTWNIPDFTVSFYSSQILEETVSWIPNSHYSGIYGLMKLSILDILHPKVEKVIVLDIDLVFLSDIAELWDMFSKFGPKQAIGLVDNQSYWYLGNITSKNPWPAVGRGFNTGVILMDLKKMNDINWTTLWNNVTTDRLKHYRSTALADQDIFNAVIKVHFDILHTLPCVWNVQLSWFSRARICYDGDTTRVKLLHWNAHRGLKSRNNPWFLYQYFVTFTVLDSKLLRKPTTKCQKIVTRNDDINVEETDFCQNMVDNASKLRRVHLYFLDFKQNFTTNDVTLVSHLSKDRISMLELIANRWIGPISVAIYISEHDIIKLKNTITNSPSLSTRTNIGYHLVYEDTDDITYPINILRNIALQEAVTDFVFLCDVDFMPSSGLYQYLTNYILVTGRQNDKIAYVVPAFEKLLYDVDIPENKSDLLKDWNSGVIVPFRAYMWPEGHRPTNYTKWQHSYDQYQVEWTKNYEPYVVVSKSACPKFDKRFFGFGWNKVSHIMELDAAGFQFTVVPYGFIVHIAHFSSPDLHKFRLSKEYRDCVMSLKSEFIDDLLDKYKVTNRDRYT